MARLAFIFVFLFSLPMGVHGNVHKMPFTGALIPHAWIQEFGALPTKDYALRLRVDYDARVFICHATEHSHRQFDGYNPDFSGIDSNLDSDEAQAKIDFCNQFASPAMEVALGIFIKPGVAFDPDPDLPAAQRDYPVILVRETALRETLVHESLHLMIFLQRPQVGFLLSSKQYDAFAKELDRLLEVVSEEAEPLDMASDKLKLARVYFELSLSDNGEELDVYQLMVIHHDALQLSADGRKGSAIGALDRLMRLIDTLNFYVLPLRDELKGLEDPEVVEAKTELQKLIDRSTETIMEAILWAQKSDSSILDQFKRYDVEVFRRRLLGLDS